MSSLSLALRPGLYPDVVALLMSTVLPGRARLAGPTGGQQVVIEGVSKRVLLMALARFRVRHTLRARALAWLAAGGDPAIEDRWSREVLHSEHAGALLALAVRTRVSA